MGLGIALVLCLDMLESMHIHRLVCTQLHVKEREKFTKLEHKAKIDIEVATVLKRNTSELNIDLRSSQIVCGFPTNPSKHTHMGR